MISAQEKRIVTLDDSKCASRQDTHSAIVKIGDEVISEVTFTLFFQKQHPMGEFQLKHPVE
jgi:hypothetical protein